MTIQDVSIPQSVVVDDDTIKENVDGEIYVSNIDNASSDEMTKQAIEIIELQANATVSPFDHDSFICDTFSDADGYLDSVTGGTATFDTDKFKRAGASIDKTNTSSLNSGSSGIFFTENPVNDKISTVILRAKMNNSSYYADFSIKFTYDDETTFTTATQRCQTESYTDYTFTNTSPTKTITKYEAILSMSSSICYQTTITSYRASSDTVICDLPTISGTVTDTQLVVRESDTETGTSVTYDITDGSQTDSDLAIDTKNALTNLTNNPTAITINLNAGDNLTSGKPAVKTYCLKVWKSA